MTRDIHILIDNTFPRRLTEELRDLWHSSYPGWRIDHVIDFAKACTRDKHWIAELHERDKNRDWLVITKDKGSGDQRASDKLPLLCKRHGHAYIVLSGEAGDRMDEFKTAIAAVWTSFPKVIDACRMLKHLPHVHVKLSRLTKKGNSIGHALKVQHRLLEQFLAEQHAGNNPGTA